MLGLLPAVSPRLNEIRLVTSQSASSRPSCQRANPTCDLHPSSTARRQTQNIPQVHQTVPSDKVRDGETPDQLIQNEKGTPTNFESPVLRLSLRVVKSFFTSLFIAFSICMVPFSIDCLARFVRRTPGAPRPSVLGSARSFCCPPFIGGHVQVWRPFREE
jgi:hypothetical protein